jgi:hypothetical protein
MNSVNGLFLRRRVPPWVEKEHSVRSDEVQAEAACLHRDEEDLDGSVIREGTNGLITSALGHLTIKSSVCDAFFAESEFEKVKLSMGKTNS